MALTSAKMAQLIPRRHIEVINHLFELHVSLSDLTIEARERAAQDGVKLLQQLKPVIQHAPSNIETQPWLEQSEKALNQVLQKKAIIGIVGGTGAGKTSFINALLDEETLLPTNCMRACTATITEISYNDGPKKYRAIIEFLSRADWRDELEKGFQVLLDSNGKIVKDATNEDSDAGIFYSKIRAIYSDLTRDAIERCTVDSLLNHSDVGVLDRTEDFQDNDVVAFADNLQRIIDSKDRVSRRSGKDLAYWPIIKRVRLFVRAKALQSGVTLVDLPGIQDSTPARAKVAENYMKSCSGLIVTAPVHRAKDDRVAKNLLGPTFRRQLMMDGGYSTMTFVCTKIDEINIREISATVPSIKMGLEKLSDSIDQYNREHTAAEEHLEVKKAELNLAEEAFVNTSAKCDVYEDLARESRHLFVPGGSRKRTNDDSTQPAAKRQAIGKPANEEGEVQIERAQEEEPDERAQKEYEHVHQQFQQYQVLRHESKISKDNLADEVSRLATKLVEIKAAVAWVENEKRSLCIRYRNQYVIEAIKEDFVAGVKECDQERTALDDEWDPAVGTRNYDKLKTELPVLTVSSKAFQKKMGRMKEEVDIPGFTTLEDTGIPTALRHCEQLTQASRKKNADFFLAMTSRLLNNLNLWLANQINSCKVSDMHREQARLTLQDRLAKLKTSFERLSQQTTCEVETHIRDTLWKVLRAARTNATKACTQTVHSWGKHSHATWKAICRRDGLYNNELVSCDWNGDLIAPMLATIAPSWEAAFSSELDKFFADLSLRARKKIKDMHASIPELLSPFGINSRHSYQRLESMFTGYRHALAEIEDQASEYLSTQQRDINRCFKPNIAESMQPAYSTCMNLSGTGSFKQMKRYMSEHVEEREEMFNTTVKAARKKILRLLANLRELLDAELEKVHAQIAKDYIETLCGDGADKDFKTDATDVFVGQIAYFLETCRTTFERGQTEHQKRLAKFGSVLEISSSAQRPTMMAPAQVYDLEDDGDANQDNFYRNAFTTLSRRGQSQGIELPGYTDTQREKGAHPMQNRHAHGAGTNMTGPIVKMEPRNDFPTRYNAAEYEFATPSVENIPAYDGRVHDWVGETSKMVGSVFDSGFGGSGNNQNKGTVVVDDEGLFVD